MLSAPIYLCYVSLLLAKYNSSSGSLEDIATIGGSPVILDDLLFSYNENGEFSWAIFD